MLHAGSAAVEVFRECSLKLVDELQEALPGVDFSAERAYFTQGSEAGVLWSAGAPAARTDLRRQGARFRKDVMKGQ